jgi:hypothetical protein
MKPMLPFRLPRLYVSIIVYAILFTALNIFIIFYGRNLFIYFQAIWSWAGILLMAMIGAMLIGMVLAYRILALREFTPFEREMMEMRVEVTELKAIVKELRDRLAPVEADGGEPEEPDESAA